MIRLQTHFRRCAPVITAAAALLSWAGCGRSDPKDAELRRKQAEHLLAEADFAVNLREWTRAEGLLLKAADVAPDEAEIWVSLGAARVLRGDKGLARTAYEKALSLYAGAASEKAGAPAEPWLRQIHILALLGREKDARSLLEKAGRRLDGNREVKAFIDGRELDRLLADPAFAKVRL
jgi:tetratricopeptide (TPR) repeat protein